MTFIISRKLTIIEARKAILALAEWFRQNPKRRICRTEDFVVRKGHIAEDVLKHTNKIKKQ